MKNTLKITLRNLNKSRLFTALNGIGLAVGLAGFMLIAAYVIDELSFDRFHENAERIVRVDAHIGIGESSLDMAQTSDMMGGVLKNDYPEVEEYARIYAATGSKLIKKQTHWINEPSVAHADSTFFRVFTFQGITGDIQTALAGPNKVVLSASAAKRYFNTTDAVGKTLETNDNGNTVYEVTAVIEDMPRNSHFRYDMLFSMDNAHYGDWGEFLSHNFNTYLLLRPGTDTEALEARLEQYVQKYCLPAAKGIMDISSMEEFRRQGNRFYYALTPLTDIHLHSNLTGELGPNGNIQYVYIFGAISLFILLIACVNFMNLSLARSANRAKGVSVRKVLGSSKGALIGQFLAESVFLSVCATVLALLLVFAILPLFNTISGKSLIFADIINWRTLPLVLLLSLGTGVVAGYYPALFLSAAKPVKVLKSQTVIASAKSPMRNALVVFQFTASIVLIIGTLVVARQLQYIQSKQLGYERENMILVNDYYALGNQTKTFRDEVLQLSGVKMGTISGFLPVSSSNRSDNTYSRGAVMSGTNSVSMQSWRVDDQYLPTFGLELKAGRNFDHTRPADSTAVILNEIAVRNLGYTGDPVGEKLYFTLNGEPVAYDIIGVVKDFNFESLRDPVTPLGFFLKDHPIQAAFKVQQANIPALISQMEQLWDNMAPGYPFSYRFMDDAFDAMYRSEQRTGLLSLCFSTIAILIACLGLFGLAAFTAEQRTKEIGVRKVLGASVSGIVQLLSKDFIRLVLFALVIASPIAWWAMNHWLQDFAYHIDIQWWMFAVAGLAAVVIALLTVSFQAVKAAVANPVESLRDE